MFPKAEAWNHTKDDELMSSKAPKMASQPDPAPPN